VIRVFFTPGWGAVLTAGGTLGGVIVTQVINSWNKHIDAKSKKADRQHERALDYEQRIWQAKNDALKRLISACRFVKWQLTSAENTAENYRRGVTIRALDLFRERIGGEDGISEIEAYAAEPVRTALDEILQEVNEQRRIHRSPLSLLRRIGTQLMAIKDPLPDVLGTTLTETMESLSEDAQELVHQHGRLLGQRSQALYDIGNESDLDVNSVIALCDRVIDVARKDLQGRYTEQGILIHRRGTVTDGATSKTVRTMKNVKPCDQKDSTPDDSADVAAIDMVR
jgi:hypothetical protein